MNAVVTLKCSDCGQPVGSHHRPPCRYITPGYSSRVNVAEAVPHRGVRNAC